MTFCQRDLDHGNANHVFREAVELVEVSADELALRLRTGPVRMFTRIQHDRVLVDLRSVLAEEDSAVVQALTAAGAVRAG